jgi:hypothetical protein
VRHWSLAHRLHMSCNAVITLHSSSHRDVRQHCARVAGGQRALMETSPAPHSAERASSVGVNGSGWRAVTRQDRYFSTDASSRHPRQAHTYRHVHARRQLLSQSETRVLHEKQTRYSADPMARRQQTAHTHMQLSHVCSRTPPTNLDSPDSSQGYHGTDFNVMNL